MIQAAEGEGDDLIKNKIVLSVLAPMPLEFTVQSTGA